MAGHSVLLQAPVSCGAAAAHAAPAAPAGEDERRGEERAELQQLLVLACGGGALLLPAGSAKGGDEGRGRAGGTRADALAAARAGMGRSSSAGIGAGNCGSGGDWAGLNERPTRRALRFWQKIERPKMTKLCGGSMGGHPLPR